MTTCRAFSNSQMRSIVREKLKANYSVKWTAANLGLSTSEVARIARAEGLGRIGHVKSWLGRCLRCQSQS